MGEGIIIRPDEYKFSGESIPDVVYDLIHRIDTLRDDTMPYIRAMVFDNTITIEERSKCNQLVERLEQRIKQADFLIAEIEKYLKGGGINFNKLIEDDKFKNLQKLIGSIEQIFSGKEISEMLEHIRQQFEYETEENDSLLIPDSFHPEWYSEADIELANHTLAQDIEKLIGPNVELISHLKILTNFLFDPKTIVELKRRMDADSILQPSSLLFIKEKSPQVWDSLIALLQSSDGKNIILQVLGRPHGALPNQEEMENYTKKMREKIPNSIAIALAYSIENLDRDNEGLLRSEKDALTQFYGTLPQQLDYHHEALIYQVQLAEILEKIEDTETKEHIEEGLKIIQKGKRLTTKELRKQLNVLTDFFDELPTHFEKLDDETRKKILTLVITCVEKIFELIQETQREQKKLTKEVVEGPSVWRRIQGLFTRNPQDQLKIVDAELSILFASIQNIVSFINIFARNYQNSPQETIPSVHFSVSSFTDTSIGSYEMDRNQQKKEQITIEDVIEDVNIVYVSQLALSVHTQDDIPKNATNLFRLRPQTIGNLQKKDFSGFNFEGTRFTNADVEGSCFKDARGLPEYIMHGLDDDGIFWYYVLIDNLKQGKIKNLQGAPDLSRFINKEIDLDGVVIDPESCGKLPAVKQALDTRGHFDRKKLSKLIKEGKVRTISKLCVKNIDLHDEYIRDLDCSDSDLSGAIFSASRIEQLNFTNSTLTNVKFRNVTFSGGKTKFIDSILNDADFSGSDLTNTDFGEINDETAKNLHGANFRNCANIPPNIRPYLNENSIFDKSLKKSA